MTAGKAPQAILRVMHNSLSESNSEGTHDSIILEPFSLALALNFALALAKPLLWPEICPNTGVAPPPGLEFALALAKLLLWPEICPSTGETLVCLEFALALAKPLVCLKFALALGKPLVWPEICPTTGKTPCLA